MKGDGFVKKFEAPVIETIAFDVEDVITVSIGFVPPEEYEDQTPYG